MLLAKIDFTLPAVGITRVPERLTPDCLDHLITQSRRIDFLVRCGGDIHVYGAFLQVNHGIPTYEDVRHLRDFLHKPGMP